MNRLLTFAPMIDSETTRLLCRWYAIAYEETDHLFGWVSLLTLVHGGYGRVPLLHGQGLRLSGPRAVTDRFDPRARPHRRLLWSADAEADWSAYNGQFALDVAVFAYFHLLSDRALMQPVFAAPVPPHEARLLPRVYPAMAWLLITLLQLKPDHAAAADQRIRTQFAALDRRLADGRPFLCGDRLSLGDIALAAAAAPLLQPDGFGTVMPPAEVMPDAVRETIVVLRACRTAGYVQRVYKEIMASSDQNSL